MSFINTLFISFNQEMGAYMETHLRVQGCALKQGNSIKIICYFSSKILIPAFFLKNADFGSHMTFLCKEQENLANMEISCW